MGGICPVQDVFIPCALTVPKLMASVTTVIRGRTSQHLRINLGLLWKSRLSMMNAASAADGTTAMQIIALTVDVPAEL